jgi:hypothetical protein
MLLRRLAASRDIAALKILAGVVEPGEGLPARRAAARSNDAVADDAPGGRGQYRQSRRARSQASDGCDAGRCPALRAEPRSPARDFRTLARQPQGAGRADRSRACAERSRAARGRPRGSRRGRPRLARHARACGHPAPRVARRPAGDSRSRRPPQGRARVSDGADDARARVRRDVTGRSTDDETGRMARAREGAGRTAAARRGGVPQ